MVGVFVVLPLGRMFVESTGGGADFSAYRAFFESNAQRKALVITFRDSVVVTALTLLMGSVVAWNLHVQRNRFLKALLWTAVVVPFLMGVVIKNYALTIILQ